MSQAPQESGGDASVLLTAGVVQQFSQRQACLQIALLIRELPQLLFMHHALLLKPLLDCCEALLRRGCPLLFR